MAPMPSGMAFTSKEGAIVNPNAIQTKLMGILEETVAEALDNMKGKPALLVFGGDQCEGVHHGGQQIVTDQPKEHEEIFKKIAAPIVERVKKDGGELLVLNGTDCHDRLSADSIGKHFNALRDELTGKYCFDRCQVFMRGCLMDFAHHQPTSSRAHTEATRMGTILSTASYSAIRDGYPIAQLMARWHAHNPGFFSNGRQKYISGGHYQAHTRHGYKVVGESSQCFGCWTAKFMDGKKLPWVDMILRPVNFVRRVDL